MALVFCDEKWFLMIDYLPKRQTINGDFYGRTKIFNEKGKVYCKNKLFFTRIMRVFHSSVTAMVKVKELK